MITDTSAAIIDRIAAIRKNAGSIEILVTHAHSRKLLERIYAIGNAIIFAIRTL